MSNTVTGVGATDPQVGPAINKSLGMLGSEDFLQLLLTQLKNQDPTNPMDNKEILQQMSSLRMLESNTQLTEAIQDLTFKQQISSGAALLGRSVKAVGGAGQQVAGRVTGVLVAEDGISLTLLDADQAEQRVPFGNVVEVTEGAQS